MAKYDFLEQQVEKGVSVVRINRPPANALNVELVEELHAMVDELAADGNVRAVVITGQGSFFAGGADIKMMQERKGRELAPFLEAFTVHLQRVFNKIEEMPKPVIAAVNGYAAGGGCELALACDFRFMTRGKAKIGLPEVKLGLLPGGGGLQRMPRLVGKAKALELAMTGDLITPEEALEIGLVNRIFEQDELMDKAVEYAEKLAKQATLAVGMIKRCINRGLDTTVRAGLSFDVDSQDLLLQSRDALEGIEAFVQKRPALFEGK